MKKTMAEQQLDILRKLYEPPMTDQEIKDNIDALSKKLGMRCKACSKEITGDNCNDHWLFKCNPDYIPEPIVLPFIYVKPAADKSTQPASLPANPDGQNP